MTNLAENLLHSAQSFPDRPALRLGDVTMSYAEFDESAARAATRMASLGVRPGDRVGLMLPNVLEFPVLFYGALKLGAIVVPMNPLLKGREIAHYTGDSGMVLLWASDAVAEADTAEVAEGCRVQLVHPGLLADLANDAVAGCIEKADGDTAVVLYTSGTTGTPKGAELTHGGLNRNLHACTDELMIISEHDVIMGCLPLFHVFGLTCGLNAAVSAAAELVLVPRFDPQLVLTSIRDHKVTVFEGVPTMYTAMASLEGVGPDDVATLRVCSSGGAALPVEILRSFESKFGAKILEGYGLSETSPVASFNRVDNARVGSIGTPIPGVEFRVVGADGNDVATGEPGEIWIRGHNVMKGYWNRPEATAEAIDDEGWFKSGDVGRVDEDGFYYIVDRKKELIIRGGFNVYPREIEEVLYEHPAVREAAVIGLPHDTHGEEVGAAVALKPGSSVTSEELRDYVKSRVAPYKYPRVVWFLEELPKGATGKILKRAIEKPGDA